MTILAALNKAAERLAAQGNMPAEGCSVEKISYVISLNPDGTLAGLPIDLRDTETKKPKPRQISVPSPVKRTSGIAPNFLWDKTSYVLGVTAGEGKRTAEEHAAFKTYQHECLGGNTDPGLVALLRFLDAWTPDQFTVLGWQEEMKDQNVIFVLETDRLQGLWLHERPAARALLEAPCDDGSGEGQAICLVSGVRAPVARLHPAIKGVYGGQSSGGSLVSFNLEAFTSYGHEQGDNAPVSDRVAKAYATVLNRFLTPDSGHRVQIGDASTVFWADASDAKTETLAEESFLAMFSSIDDEKQAGEVKTLLDRLRRGEPLASFAPKLAEGVRFYVLGLAPNAARLSIRFWFDNDFGTLARNYSHYLADMAIEPPPRNPSPPLWRYLVETAAQRKSENVPPALAGDWMRAILTGRRYPQTLLSTVLMRLRADKDMNPERAAILKALLIRNFNCKEAPVALDPDNRNKGYLLGRLFALYERVQTAALGDKVNATIKDKFYGAASAQPRKVFSLLDRNSANHLSKIGKLKPGYRVDLEKQLGAVMEMMTPSDDPYPAALASAEQALFGLGYYHQRQSFFKSKSESTSAAEEISA